jgi:hypothetical protein
MIGKGNCRGDTQGHNAGEHCERVSLQLLLQSVNGCSPKIKVRCTTRQNADTHQAAGENIDNAQKLDDG